MAFRFSQIERLPEPPSPYAVKGTLLHSALEGLIWNHPARRPDPADAATGELTRRPGSSCSWTRSSSQLGLEAEAAEALPGRRPLASRQLLPLEDPNEVNAVGVELGVEMHVDGMCLRGKLDRLDLAPDGSLIVVDYKTGRAPSERYERGSLVGVQTYALLCESALGRPPAEVRLLHLREPVAISSAATEQSIRGQRRRTAAVWTAIDAGLRRRGLPTPCRAAV